MPTLILLLLTMFVAVPTSAQAADAEDINTVQSMHEKSLAANPKDLNSLFVLALVYEKKDQKAQALQMWQRYLAVETQPERRAVAEKHIHLLKQ